MNLIKRIVQQKNNGDSSNFDKIMSVLRNSNDHPPQNRFVFDGLEISWSFVQSANRFEDIILEDENLIYFYLYSQDLSFECIFCGFLDDSSKNTIDSEVIIKSIFVCGQIFPGIFEFDKRPVEISVNYPFPNTKVKNLNYYFKKTINKFQNQTKPIFEITDYYKTKGWEKIVEKKKK